MTNALGLPAALCARILVILKSSENGATGTRSPAALRWPRGSR